MQNPSGRVYIAAAIIGAIGLIIAAWISGRNSGVSVGATDAQGTAEIRQATSVAQAAITQIVVTQVLVTQIIATSPPASTAAPIIVIATPTIPPPTPTPGPESIPVGTVLYQADWSKKDSGWPETAGWKTLNGMLLNDASNPVRGSSEVWVDNWISAPYQATGIDDYAVEAEIQLVSSQGCAAFGVVARGAYQAGEYICTFLRALEVMGKDVGGIGKRDFYPNNDWHKYRLEVKGNKIKLLIDGAVMIDATSNKNLSGDMVGLYDIYGEINVRSFKVIKL